MLNGQDVIKFLLSPWNILGLKLLINLCVMQKVV